MKARLDELQGQISDHWNRRSREGTGSFGIRDEREHRAWLQDLRPLLPSQPADALDVGSGLGFVTFLLTELGHRATGVDMSQGMVEAATALATQRTHPPFRLGDAMDPPLPPGSVDVVTNRQVVWTLLDPEAAFRNWFALLRPGGRVVSIHLRHVAQPGKSYTQAARQALPSLRLTSTGKLITRFDSRYPDAVADLAERVGFVDPQIVELPTVNQYEREIAGKPSYVALTCFRPFR
jgi:SAM-dependent methyltransferase